jgi:hypothetical protein
MMTSYPPETRPHGACRSGGEVVGSIHARVGGFPPRVSLALIRRRRVGEAKYGTRLRAGWEHADSALVQELLDAVDYSLVGGRLWTARLLSLLAWAILRSEDRR